MESPSSHSHEHAAYLAPTLGPEPKTSASSITDEKNTPTQQWSARPARPRLLGLIGGVVVALGSLCFAAALLAVLLVTQCKEMTNGSGFLAAIRDEYFYTVAFADAVIEPTGTKVRMWGVMISNFAVSRSCQLRYISCLIRALEPIYCGHKLNCDGPNRIQGGPRVVACVKLA